MVEPRATKLENITANDITPTYVDTPRRSYYGTTIYRIECYQIEYLIQYQGVMVTKKLYLTPEEDMIFRLSTLLDEPARIDLEGYTYLKG